METARSKNNVPIRLPDERWLHITESHSEMAGFYSDVLETVEDPDAIYEGRLGEFLAMREAQTDKYLVVVYKEVSREDGFVITSFLTRRKTQLDRRPKIWERQR
ncbi:MAG: hypothetical protein U9N48_01525 [Euryarchaeota archaeon]|nr:hypothetical protein [Euryarchaeota archaeon]